MGRIRGVYMGSSPLAECIRIESTGSLELEDGTESRISHEIGLLI